ncbi:MAG: hypothetical protein JWM04_925, partial [Verrucomicrobiales bacterium]|nr:hypothetical protein [Verrucomicrobiales bacterium]
DGEEKRMVTIQVDPRKRLIVQVRAKCNYHPGDRSMKIIGEWARASGLKFDQGIL